MPLARVKACDSVTWALLCTSFETVPDRTHLLRDIVSMARTFGNTAVLECVASRFNGANMQIRTSMLSKDGLSCIFFQQLPDC